jgi:hypothetical protein
MSFVMQIRKSDFMICIKLSNTPAFRIGEGADWFEELMLREQQNFVGPDLVSGRERVGSNISK